MKEIEVLNAIFVILVVAFFFFALCAGLLLAPMFKEVFGIVENVRSIGMV